MLASIQQKARLAPHQATVLRDSEACKNGEYWQQDPDSAFPEYRFGTKSRANPVYSALRQLFVAMGLDANNYGNASWNPLGELIRPGARVVIKPNLVYHRHYGGGELHWIITDPRLIRAVCDYVLLAIGPEGRLVIGDAPLQSADWETLVSASGLDQLPGFFAKHGYQVDLVDFRTMHSVDVRGLKCRNRALAGDPAGYRRVDLGQDSLHAGRDWKRYRVTNYDPGAMQTHHNGQRHEYLISGTVLESDIVVNLPKLKTHRKSGLTGPLKNMVGVNGCKDWLPHHSKGSVDAGGDEYAAERSWKRLNSWIVEREELSSVAAGKICWNALRRILWRTGAAFTTDGTAEGSWSGNDTLWRTIADLNRIVRYGDRHGALQEKPQRTVFTITDAIIAGEGDGPMNCRPVPIGALLAAIHPFTAETAAASLAKWPMESLKLLQGGIGSLRYPLHPEGLEELDVRCVEKIDALLAEIPMQEVARFLHPASGWQLGSKDVDQVLSGARKGLSHAG